MLAEIPKCDYITGQMLFREAYETAYTIHDHEVDEHPWALVSVREKEDIYSGGVLETFIARYRTKRVNERFGMSLKEILKLPKHVVEEIFKQCDAVAKQELEAYQSVENNINNKEK